MIWRSRVVTRTLLTAATGFALTLVLACQGAIPALLPGPFDALDGIAWASDGWIYVIAKGDSGTDDQIWRTKGTGKPQRFSDSFRGVCGYPLSYDALFTANDEVGLVARCESTGDSLVLTYSPADQSVAVRLRAEPLLESAQLLPALDSGYATVYTIVTGNECFSIVPFDTSGIRRFPKTVGRVSPSWKIDDGAVGRADECMADGDARWPMLAPDSSVLYFIGVPDAAGKYPADRKATKGALYAMSRNDGSLRMVVRGFSHVIDASVSRDGRHVAISSSDALWLVDVQRKTMSRLRTGGVRDIAFSPDGSHLAIESYSDDNAPMRVETLKLPG